MRKFWNEHLRLHRWLLADLGLLAAFWLCRGNRAWMNALADHVTTPLKLALGRLCDRVDFSVMETLCILLVLGAAFYLAAVCMRVFQARGRRWKQLYSGTLGAVCMGLTIYLGFCLLWGVNYSTDSFQDRSGIRAQPVKVETLTQVTEYFVQELARTADQVPRDERGCFAVQRSEILEKSPEVYDHLEEQFPFLALDDHLKVKGVRFSRVMSALDFTGVYCPFTGESNVNLDMPAAMLPATAAHELAHQRAISSEQECNFLAILASTTSGDSAYVYSGYLMGYLYLSNALYGADRSAWQDIRDGLPEPVKADLAQNNAYWAQFSDSASQKIANRVYDGFLKGYGEELGIRSYGTVVDLLTGYYGANQAESAEKMEKEF